MLKKIVSFTNYYKETASNIELDVTFQSRKTEIVFFVQ